MGVFKGKHAKLLTLMVSVTLIVLLAYIAITDSTEESIKRRSSIEENESSEVKEILNKNLTTDYPASVREVVKFYCRIITCLYSEDLSESEEEFLVEKECDLFDEALAEKNQYSDLLKKQQEEIKKFKKTDGRSFSYEVSKNETVKEWIHKDRNCASIDVCIKVIGKKCTQTNEKFVLRKDANGKWKIVGWVVKEAEDNEEK